MFQIRLTNGIKVIKTREVGYDPEGHFDDGRTFLLTIAAPARTSPRLIKRVLRREYNTYCQHEHDCCGRWYATVYTASLRRSKSGEWTVPVAYHCNV